MAAIFLYKNPASITNGVGKRRKNRYKNIWLRMDINKSYHKKNICQSFLCLLNAILFSISLPKSTLPHSAKVRQVITISASSE